MRGWISGLCVVVVGCAAPAANVCEVAAEHVSMCLGEATAAPACTAEMAARSEQVLAMSCEDLTADKSTGCSFFQSLVTGCTEDAAPQPADSGYDAMTDRLNALNECQASCTAEYDNECPDGIDGTDNCKLSNLTGCHRCCAENGWWCHI